MTGLPLTVLARVALVLWQTAAGWLVARVDRAVAFIQAVVLTSGAVTVGPCEAFWASTGWGTCKTRHQFEDQK